jgi:hypothetical protein
MACSSAVKILACSVRVQALDTSNDGMCIAHVVWFVVCCLAPSVKIRSVPSGIWLFRELNSFRKGEPEGPSGLRSGWRGVAVRGEMCWRSLERGYAQLVDVPHFVYQRGRDPFRVVFFGGV